jgi:hypothetical protein
MKKILFFVSLVILSLQITAQTQVKNFEDLMTSLKEGKEVRMTVYYKKCQLISDNEIDEKVPDATGGLKIDVYEYFAQKAVRNDKAFVVFSESKLIDYPKGEGYVYNYVKVKVSEDNKVKITARYIDPKTMTDVMDENFFGQINDGSNDGGIFFFAK